MLNGIMDKITEKESREKQLKLDEQNTIYSTLESCISTMEAEGIQRVVLDVQEAETTPVQSGWRNSEGHNYYPEDMLDEREKDLMRKNKSYGIVSLVAPEIPEVVKYGDFGVEMISRNRVHALLPKMNEFSQFNYLNGRGFIARKDMSMHVAEMYENGWKASELKHEFERGLADYKKRLAQKTAA